MLLILSNQESMTNDLATYSVSPAFTWKFSNFDLTCPPAINSLRSPLKRRDDNVLMDIPYIALMNCSSWNLFAQFDILTLFKYCEMLWSPFLTHGKSIVIRMKAAGIIFEASLTLIVGSSWDCFLCCQWFKTGLSF